LEDRRLLATIMVNTLTDPATPVLREISLREAIAQANPGDMITFSPGLTGTINLDSKDGAIKPQFKTNLTITGPGASTLSIDGQGATGILSIDFNTTVKISGLTLENGNSSSGYGGAIENFGNLTLTDCVLSGNTASVGGGAIQNTYGLVTVTGCTISGNSAGIFGGGVENVQGSLTILDSTVANNSSGNQGGGLDNIAATMTMVNCTVSANSATSVGGGLYNNGATAKVDNTIVADSLSGGDIVNNSTLTGTNNLVSDGSGTGLSGTVTGNPLLAPLASYGGPTPTMALFAGSPAIGAAKISLAIPGVTLPHTDQRGLFRVVAGSEDIGAFQTQLGQGKTPTVAISGPATALAQQQLIFTFTVTDPTSADQGGTFAYAIDWGDNTGVEIVRGSSAVQVVHAYAAANSYNLTVTALDQGGYSSLPTKVASPFAVAALSASSLNQAVQAQTTVALQVTTVAQENAVFNAVNSVKPPTGGWNIVVNTAAGQYSDAVINTPSSGHVTVTSAPPSQASSGGSGGTVVSGGSTPPPAFASWSQVTNTNSNISGAATFQGNSPALTVDQGTTTWSGIELLTKTDSPTILVTGGTLILQDDFINGTPSRNQPVIEVDGGTLILGPAITINPTTNGSARTGSGGGKVQVQGNVVAAFGTAAFVHVTGAGKVIDEGGTTYDRVASDGTLMPVSSHVTVTQLASSASPAVYGQPVTYTATVTNISGTEVVPTGTVQFVVDGTNLGTAVPLDAAGQAVSPAVSFLTGTNHTVQSVYNPSPGFMGSNTSLTQVAQAVAVEPDSSNHALTDLFLGSPGTTSNDEVQVKPVGGSSTGNTGVEVHTSLDGVSVATTYNQSFTTIFVFLQNGNDTVELASSLTINAVVTAGAGNDHVTLGNGDNIVTLGNGNDAVLVGDGTDIVTVGNGNDNVKLGDGTDTVTVGNGNDNVKLGDGSDVIVEGNGNDNVTAGDGADLVVGGLGQHTIQLGNGNDILIDGSATVVNSGDSFQQILSDWNSNSSASVDTRLKVVYNTTHPNVLRAGSGRDWWFFTENKDSTNIKNTDRLN
jgi:hypothetical protein